MADLYKLSIPVKNPSTGKVEIQEFDVRGSVPTNVYKTDDSPEIELADNDYIPFYDTSATAKKKVLWSIIVAKIKSAIGIASSGDTYLRKDGTWATPAESATGTTYDAGSCPDDTHLATNGSVSRAYTALNTGKINPPNVLSATRKSALNGDGTASTFTSTGGYYCVVAINASTSGQCSAYITTTSGAYLSATTSPDGNYKRASTQWLYFPSGTKFSARGFFTDTANSGLFFANPL